MADSSTGNNPYTFFILFIFNLFLLLSNQSLFYCDLAAVLCECESNDLVAIVVVLYDLFCKSRVFRIFFSDLSGLFVLTLHCSLMPHREGISGFLRTIVWSERIQIEQRVGVELVKLGVILVVIWNFSLDFSSFEETHVTMLPNSSVNDELISNFSYFLSLLFIIVVNGSDSKSVCCFYLVLSILFWGLHAP